MKRTWCLFEYLFPARCTLNTHGLQALLAGTLLLVILLFLLRHTVEEDGVRDCFGGYILPFVIHSDDISSGVKFGLIGVLCFINDFTNVTLFLWPIIIFFVLFIPILFSIFFISLSIIFGPINFITMIVFTVLTPIITSTVYYFTIASRLLLMIL